jgi:PEP-CTERM motif-containing protein
MQLFKKHTAFISSLALLILVTLGSGIALAIPLGSLDIDFRTSLWSGANYQPSFQVGDVTATAFPAQPGLYQDLIDGLGIRGGEQDETDANELLTLTFDGGLTLWGVGITDLFTSGDGAGELAGEHGRATIYDTLGNSLASFDFYGINSDQGNGELYIGFQTAFLNVGSILFTAVPWQGSTSNNEFSVAGLNTTSPIPEPSTMLFFGVGLVGVVGTKLRRKK